MSFDGSNATDLLYVALGNPLRHDDGAAWAVVEAMDPARSLARLQATPELATEISGARRVVFIDAAVQGELRLERIEHFSPSSLTHAVNPSEVVALARLLYGFTGEAWLCRIPGKDFTPGEGLSWRANTNARLAVSLLRDWCNADA